MYGSDRSPIPIISMQHWRRRSAVWPTAAAAILAAVALFAAASTARAQAPAKKPNILFIMGDDIGWFNIGAYHQGIMAGKTPNLDRLAGEGMRFTDYYAEASCTAGRANFITGELPIRTGMTTVGQAGSPLGLPAEAPTIATVLKSMGYATGQFGKNHLGDLNKFLPCVHGFDEFFGYLYHLDAMEDPDHRNYPQALRDTVGPRNMVTCHATDKDDPTEQPRWGRVGKQTIKDEGPLDPKRMETVDDEILARTLAFLDQAKKDGKPFFIWLNPTRMHVVTHLSEQVREHAQRRERLVHRRGRHGTARRHRRRGDAEAQGRGARQRHHPRVQHGQRHGELHLARRRPDAVRRRQGHRDGRRLPRSSHDSLAREGSCGQGRERHFSGLDWFPTFVAAAGDPNIGDELLKGRQFGGTSYKVHLDGYDQTDCSPAGGRRSGTRSSTSRECTLGAVRIDDYKYRFIDQPDGWLGGTVKVDWPILVNLRLDPFERTGLPRCWRRLVALLQLVRSTSSGALSS